MSVSGKGARDKGHNFEREIANIFKRYFPEAKRGYQSRNHIDLVPDVDVPWFYIECKRGKRTNIKAALQQAKEKRKSTDNRLSLAICKDDRKDAIVSLSLEDFLKLLDVIFLDRRMTDVVPSSN